jgi:hypothetical protein
MDIAKKIQIVAEGIASIATHTDEDSVVLLAALSAVEKIVLDAQIAVEKKAHDDAAAALAPKA